VSGYSKENASACEDTKNTFTTCEQSGLKYGLNATSHVDANGKAIEKCRRHDERIDMYKRYAEYYDACNVKRRISPCGLVEEDPKCFLKEMREGSTEPQYVNLRKVECEACYDNRSGIVKNSSDYLWTTCNIEKGYTGKLCQKCLPGFARDSGRKMACRKCGPTELNYFFIFLGVMIAMGFLMGFISMNMQVAGSTSVSGAAQKIFLNYMQFVSLAASFPLMWPPEVQVLFAVQSSASSFSDQLMDFDCEMAKQEKICKYFIKSKYFMRYFHFRYCYLMQPFGYLRRNLMGAMQLKICFSKKKIKQLHFYIKNGCQNLKVLRRKLEFRKNNQIMSFQLRM
jgi:hypothetical protein